MLVYVAKEQLAAKHRSHRFRAFGLTASRHYNDRIAIRNQEEGGHTVAIAIRLEAVVLRLEAITSSFLLLVGWRPFFAAGSGSRCRALEETYGRLP